jgi:hypothetical protein
MHRGLPGINTTLVFVRRRLLDKYPSAEHLLDLTQVGLTDDIIV